MFLLYVNDIGNNFPSDILKLFADDCLLYKTINSISDEEQLQQDLYTMVEWSNTWLMRFQSYTFWTVQPMVFLIVKYDVLTSFWHPLPVMRTPWAVLK